MEPRETPEQGARRQGRAATDTISLAKARHRLREALYALRPEQHGQFTVRETARRRDVPRTSLARSWDLLIRDVYPQGRMARPTDAQRQWQLDARKAAEACWAGQTADAPSGSRLHAIDVRQMQAEREWRSNGRARRWFGTHVGKMIHKDENAVDRFLQDKQDRVAGKDYGIEYTIRGRRGNMDRLDFVDFRRDRIADTKPQAEGESLQDIAQKYAGQFRRYLRAYRRDTGRRATYDIRTYPSVKDLYSRQRRPPEGDER
jgi:hypothetical protein